MHLYLFGVNLMISSQQKSIVAFTTLHKQPFALLVVVELPAF